MLVKQSKSIEFAGAKYNKKTGLMISQVEALIGGASVEELVAYMMHFGSKHNLSKRSLEGYRRWEILEVVNTHCTVALFEMTVAPGFRNRTFLCALLWQKVSDEPLTYIWVQVPIERHDKVTPVDEAHTLRGRRTSCLRVTRVSHDVSKVEYTCSIHEEERLPTRLEDFMVAKLTRLPYDLQMYFLQIKLPNSATAADAAVVGHIVIDVAEAAARHHRASAIKTVVERTAFLRESAVASLDALLTSTLSESVNSLLPPSVTAENPATLKAVEATAIGFGFEAIIRVSANPCEAVDDLFHTYHALTVADQQHDWLRSFLETIAKRRIANATLGLKLRLAIGASFSIGDMLSDVAQLLRMFIDGNTTPAFTLLTMLLTNLAFQSLLVIMQRAHHGWHAVAWELIIVFSLLKPGIDAIRVAGGEDRVEGAPLDPFMEMILGKLSELTFESIPGGLTQLAILLNGGVWTRLAIVSVLLSCLSTAFTACSLAYELDTNAARRKRNPEFYGYIPDTSTGHFWAFMFLFIYHSTYTIGNTFSMACLLQTNWMWLVVYVLADHCGLILYKLARGDLIYWIPALGVPLSVLSRFIVKVVTDFTGCAFQPPA
jgi:hypothetical protein